MIGETIDPADEICGARGARAPNVSRMPVSDAPELRRCHAMPLAVVDKSTGNRQMYRLELWFRKNDKAISDQLLGAPHATARRPDLSALCPAPLAPRPPPRPPGPTPLPTSCARRTHERGAGQVLQHVQMGVTAALGSHGAARRGLRLTRKHAERALSPDDQTPQRRGACGAACPTG